MKKKNVFLFLALCIGLTTFAQRGGPDRPHESFHNDLTVEQMATIKTKKMTLALDLTQKQQEEIFQFNLAQAKFRKSKMEESEGSRPTTEERYAMENERLDHMIAQQQELKKILNDEQFDQWKKMQLHQHAHAKKQRHKERRSR